MERAFRVTCRERYMEFVVIRLGCFPLLLLVATVGAICVVVQTEFGANGAQIRKFRRMRMLDEPPRKIRCEMTIIIATTYFCFLSFLLGSTVPIFFLSKTTLPKRRRLNENAKLLLLHAALADVSPLDPLDDCGLQRRRLGLSRGQWQKTRRCHLALGSAIQGA